MSNIHRQFFDQGNYELLYNIIRDEFIKKLNYDIMENRELYTDQLVNIMKTIYQNNKSTNDMKLLNKLTLKNTLPLFANHINTNQINNRKINISTSDQVQSIRDVEISSKNQVPFIPLRPQQSSTPEEINSVSRTFDDISMERQNELSQRPTVPNFQIPQNSDQNLEDSNNRYELESKRREMELQSKVPQMEERLNSEDTQRLINHDLAREENNSFKGTSLDNLPFKGTSLDDLPLPNNSINNEYNPDMFSQSVANIQPETQIPSGTLNMPDDMQFNENNGNNSELDAQFRTQQEHMNEFERKRKELEQNDKEFSDRLKQKQMERSINFFDSTKNNNNQLTEQNPLLPSNKTHDSWESTQHTQLDDTSRRIHERSRIEKDIQTQEKIEPKELFKPVEEIKEKLEERFQKETTKREEDIVQKVETYSKNVSHMITINSYDRDFVSEIAQLSSKYPDNADIITLENKQYKGRYNYMIRFSPAENEWIKQPIYKNNPTKPASEEEAKIGKKGIPNNKIELNPSNIGIYGEAGGFIFNGITCEPYDPNKPVGNLIGYEYIQYLGNLGASVPKLFRNVTEISIEHVILPVDFLSLNYTQLTKLGGLPNYCPSFITNILSYPYLLLYIDEIDGTFNGSNDAVNKAFSQLVVQRDYSANKINSANYGSNLAKDYGFVHFTPLSTGTKTFKTPLSILDRLTIRILTPYGTEIKVPRDLFRIKQIKPIKEKEVYNGRGTPMVNYKNEFCIIEIELQEDSYFTGSLTAGCIICLKNLKFTNKQPNSEQIAIQQFLLRNEGHTVLGCSIDSTSTEITTSNKIYIENYTNDGPYCWNTSHSAINVPSAFTSSVNFDFKETPLESWEYECKEETSISTNNIIKSVNKGTFTNDTEIYQDIPVLFDMSLQNNLLFKITTQEMEAAAPIYGVNN